MAPIAYAVSFVYHQQPRCRRQLWDNIVTEVRVCQTLRTNQKRIYFSLKYLVVDIIPFGKVDRIDCPSDDPSPVCRIDLIPHEGEQRGNDLGAATLERRSSLLGIAVADPAGCGIPSKHRSRQRGRWRGV